MDSKKALQQQVFAAARENGVSSVQFRNAIARRLGLNSTDGECLSLLAIKGVATPTELGRYTGLTSGATTAMLDRLEQAGFISRRPNPADRRGVLVTLNQKWAETAGPLVAGVQQAQADLIAGYSAAELAIIADFLARFTANVQAQTERIEQDRV